MHLVIDGFGGNASKMWDEQLVRQFLTDYPDALEMTRITEPRVLVYDAPKPEDSGVSGFVIIAREPYQHPHLPPEELRQHRHFLLPSL